MGNVKNIQNNVKCHIFEVGKKPSVYNSEHVKMSILELTQRNFSKLIILLFQ